MDVQKLIELPVQIQIALGSGFVGYCIAYFGIRSDHSNFDRIFITLVFSMIATGAGYFTQPLGEIQSFISEFVITVAFSVLWRIAIRPVALKVLRTLAISWTDEAPSALRTLMANTKYKFSQIAVQLEDGTWLNCSDLSQFADSPFGPAKIGKNGDIAIYLTDEETPDGKSKQYTSVIDPNWGARITYIPASQIKQITLRHI